jgi:hypothetical protein
MELNEIISITGQGGLFKVIARTKTGLIVESLKDNKRQPVSGTQKISALEDVSLFGQSEDVPLTKVFKNIFDKENGGKAIDAKSDDKSLKAYFLAVFPDYDQSRVYVSDIKKVFTWYNTLHDLGLLKPIAENKQENNESSDEAKKLDDKEAKAKAKKVAALKPAAKVKESAAPKASSKAKGGKTSTIRKTGA